MDRKKTQSIVEHVLYEFFGNGNLSKYEQFVEKDIKVHYPLGSRALGLFSLSGRDDVKIVDEQYCEAFQVKKIEIGDMLLDENKVLARWSATVNHRKDFFLLKRSNKLIDLTGQTVYELNRKEKIQEVWQFWDLLGLMYQVNKERSQDLENPNLTKLLAQWNLLSEREKECMRQLIVGKTAKETAAHMNLSFRTIEYYFENIKNKLCCLNKRELYRYARQLEASHGFVIMSANKSRAVARADPIPDSIDV